VKSVSYASLVLRADVLMGCTEGSPEEVELALLTDAIEAYEAMKNVIASSV